MGRAREYASAAARQAAYRARQEWKQPARQGLLAALARTLHGELVDAVAAERCPVPVEWVGGRAEETLRQMIRGVRGEREREEAEAAVDAQEAKEKGGEAD
jgi:hypothetical protein